MDKDLFFKKKNKSRKITPRTRDMTETIKSK